MFFKIINSLKSNKFITLASRNRKILLVTIDLLMMAFVYFSLVFFYTEGSGNKMLDTRGHLINAAIFVGLTLIIRLIVGIYSSIWRYANSYSYLKLIIADLIACVSFLFLTKLIDGAYIGAWQSISVVCVTSLITLVSRFIYQRTYTYLHKASVNDVGEKINVAIIGAGRVGAMLAEDLKNSPKSKYNPICFIDKNPEKVGKSILGIKIFAEKDNIFRRLKQMPLGGIILALPDLDAEEKQKVYEFYAQTGLPIRIYDFAFGNEDPDKHDRKVRKINIEDLLFRKPVELVNNVSKNFFKGKRILVTGGGGSIGSEICRQIARCEPAQLIILDIYENNAYNIQQELIRAHEGKLNLSVEIATVRDRARLESIFAHYKPQIVFHAAAHKHVPLMEHSSCEAIKNNIIGTYNTADMAEKFNAEKFILISTDKAVNPTNIMGASKRMCEMIVQSRFDSNTSFAAVRFGNVLGSNGSVIPLFKKQIEEGGPVTITDKRIIRYFMTIPEAAQLVLHTCVMAKSGELFVLDMGKPVKILDLAENMIRLSGYTPYKDIDIVEIGLRPGEKLYEELLIKKENLSVTENKLIFIEKDKPHTRSEIDEKLEILLHALKKSGNASDSKYIKEAMFTVVPNYCEPQRVNNTAHFAKEMIMAESNLKAEKEEALI